MNFREALNAGFVFLDGSMGALLQSKQADGSCPSGWKLPEELNLTHPQIIQSIHESYLAAGANVVLTNTFGGTHCKLDEAGLSVEQTVTAAVKIAQAATSKHPGSFVALNIGPTGKLLEPMGSFTFDEAYEAFSEQVRAGAAAGADLALIETMSDPYEMKAAMLAVKENSDMPVIASATFQENNRTLSGADPKSIVATMEGLGADAIGFNCGGDLAHALELAREFVQWASVPVFMEPNAGIPIVKNGITVFLVSPEDFAGAMAEAATLGVRVLGGCCGTTPEHIKAMTSACSKISPIPVTRKDTVMVSSWSGTVELGRGPVIIGERINPTGKKKFREALLDNDMNYVLNEGKKQIEAGAHILDVNVGLPGIDEAAVMVRAVRELQRTFPTPLQIDSSEPEVLERALRYYNGKPLVNSVNGKKSVMNEVFPIVKKYGGVLVALALDENGISNTAEGRLAVAEKIVTEAEAHGIDRKNIIIDTLTMTVSSQQKEAMETVRAIPLVKEKLGVKTVLGVSNISFGLPQRDLINTFFFASALNAGLDACIINPLSEPMMAVWRSYRALSGHDENCLNYIDAYSASPAITLAPPKMSSQTHVATDTADKTSTQDPSDLRDEFKAVIVAGLRDLSRSLAEQLLRQYSPVEIIDECIVPALDEVGRDYETGKKFLPQLLLSADTVSRAFEAIKAFLETSGTKTEPKGSIVIATVHGDIHDIGKNIVKAMLENYGYQVHDLGKDVSPEKVVEAVREIKPEIVGLSALMTTTVINMEKTIKMLREAKMPVKIMVGGAVLSPEYAERIGADYYGKDAMASVSIARKVFGK